MDNFIEMDFDEWVDTYKPIPNNIDTNASFDGLMFETYGDEVEFVKKVDPNYIWMYSIKNSTMLRKAPAKNATPPILKGNYNGYLY
jgi:hypothetical protein